MTLAWLGELAAAILASLGGAAVVIGYFSDQLGKVWADRLMAKERAAHDRDLAELRNRLEAQTKEGLAALETELSIL